MAEEETRSGSGRCQIPSAPSSPLESSKHLESSQTNYFSINYNINEKIIPKWEFRMMSAWNVSHYFGMDFVWQQNTLKPILLSSSCWIYCLRAKAAGTVCHPICEFLYLLDKDVFLYEGMWTQYLFSFLKWKLIKSRFFKVGFWMLFSCFLFRFTSLYLIIFLSYPFRYCHLITFNSWMMREWMEIWA